MTYRQILSTFERLFRRHDRFVSALILLILLGTFLVKEYFRDDYRERAAAIDSAFPMFVLSRDLEDVKEKVDDLVGRFNRGPVPGVVSDSLITTPAKPPYPLMPINNEAPVR